MSFEQATQDFRCNTERRLSDQLPQLSPVPPQWARSFCRSRCYTEQVNSQYQVTQPRYLYLTIGQADTNNRQPTMTELSICDIAPHLIVQIRLPHISGSNNIICKDPPTDHSSGIKNARECRTMRFLPVCLTLYLPMLCEVAKELLQH